MRRLVLWSYPTSLEFVTLRGSVSEFEGMPLISLRDTPLYGWNIIVKRVLDIVLSSLVIIFTSPVMLIIAILIKLTSRGHIFFKQERMGLDGKPFNMLKFRTMFINAEQETGPCLGKERRSETH